MKFLTEKRTIHKIIIAIVFVMLFNFVMPNISLATEAAATAGGILFEPIKDLLLVIADGIMMIGQTMLLGMDASFLTLSYDKNWISTAAGALGGLVAGGIAIVVGLAGAPFSGGLSLAAFAAGIKIIATTTVATVVGFVAVSYLSSKALPKTLKLPMFALTPEEIFSNKIALLDVNFFNPNPYEDITTPTESVEQTSMALTLQPTISQWYYAIRNLSIVALLSILVYMGIRIIISSSAEDKAKYKQRLMDWIVAMCLLFFMHYIMAFAMTVTQEVTRAVNSLNKPYYIAIGSSGDKLKDYVYDNDEYVFSTEADSLAESFRDPNVGIIVPETDESGNETGNEVLLWPTNLMGKARIELQLEPTEDLPQDDILMRQFGYTVIYLALVMYTILFLFRYLKRLMMLAFLTIIAPLMAMTYPLDKMRDGNAQGFNTWLKEYLFNLLIQPVHLILYTVLIGSAIDLVADNLLYSLVALGFILEGEKILRKFFGFDKASTLDSGSALGGALAMARN